MKKHSYPWGLIALLFFFFFPAGIWMLVQKVRTETLNYVKNGHSLKTLGWILLAFAVIYMILGITGDLQYEDGSSPVGVLLVVILLFGGGGLLCLWKGAAYIKKGTKYTRYLSIMNSSPTKSIDQVAAAFPTSYSTAVADLQSMLDAGYFMGAHIDHEQRTVVFPEVTDAQGQSTPISESERISVTCKNCGAPNQVVSGCANECEYCGSPL